jgi:transposase
MISEEKKQEILRYHFVEKWRPGTISRQLGIHYETVQRALRDAGAPPAISTRSSIVDPYWPFMHQTLEKFPKLPASRLYQMVKERGYLGGEDHFRHLVARIRPRRKAEAYLRLTTLAGEQGQVDWGHFGSIKVGGAEHSLMGFVLVASYSRRIFLRFFLNARMENFLRGHVAAFERWQGIFKILLYDNLKSVVLERRGETVRYNPKFREFAGHYRFEPRPVAIARGNEKGRVERAIRYIRTSFFAGREFKDLDDLNRQADAWCEGWTDCRKWHQDPHRTVGEAFADERSYLIELPTEPFQTEERGEVHIGKTPYARFDRNDYSVPFDRVRRTLTVRASLSEVRIFDGHKVVACHPRSFDRSQQIENPEHIQELVDHKRRAKKHRGLDRLRRSAPSCEELLQRLAERGLPLGTATAALLRLLDHYGTVALTSAVAEALGNHSCDVQAVRLVLERCERERQATPKLPLRLPNDPRIRDLDIRPHDLNDYDRLSRQEDPHDDD